MSTALLTPDPQAQSPIELACINTIRTLAIDAVQAANSGHPGAPMGMAPVAYCLWQQFLRFDPQDPVWPNRDRFVLSIGHASMLLFALLHLTEVRAVSEDGEVLHEASVPVDALKTFRQLDSPCPGHPEYGRTPGVETTTGPLGQGVATSVGMAVARQWLAARYNRPGFDLFDFNVYALCGDGCMMEGLSGEAASLAGHLRLANLCWIYDSNRITIEGSTSLAFSEDVAARFVAYGWNVTRVDDANDVEMLARAFRTFQETNDRPTLIIVDSHIGYGAPHKQDTSGAHGEPLGEEEARLAKRNYGWPEDKKFHVPDSVYDHFRQGVGKRGTDLRDAWYVRLAEYRKQFPELVEELSHIERRQLPEGWDHDLPEFPADAKGLATRESSSKVLNAAAKNIPWLVGGSVDLAPSAKTRLTFEGGGDFSAENYAGRNLHFGVREHAMGAILNGMSLTKVRPFGSGFFVFADYMRGSLRLSALMEIPAIYIFTHDSIGVGEDGPTHQPVEQLAHMRSTPGLIVIRPCDANEVREAWKVILQSRYEPVALVLTRQSVPTIDRSAYAAASGLARGAYVLADAPDADPEVILIGTGSEVSLCLDAYEQLAREGVRARVVSMPSWELFDRQDSEYRDLVLPPRVKARVSVEQASSFGWSRHTGIDGHAIGIDTFGASAPFQQLSKMFGFTADRIVAAARNQIVRNGIPNREEWHMRVAIGADHGGFAMKEQLAKKLAAEGHEVIDFGNVVFDADDDYPDFAIPLARAVADGDVERGILLCGSGVGASVAANKAPGARAALCHDHYSARQGVEDDDVNILCLGRRTTGIEVAWDCVRTFLGAKFTGAARHRRRVDKVKELEHGAARDLIREQYQSGKENV